MESGVGGGVRGSFRRRLSRPIGIAVAAVAILSFAAVARAGAIENKIVASAQDSVEEFHAFIKPEVSVVGTDSLVEVRFEVDSTAHHFNGYRITIEYDRAIAHFVSVSQGALFVHACSNRFSSLDSTETSITYAHSLLCNGVYVNGPGVLSVFRFRADSIGICRLRITSPPNQTFFDGGLYIWPGHTTYPRQVVLHDGEIDVVDPTSGICLDPPHADGTERQSGLSVSIVPNPTGGDTQIRLDLAAAAPVEIRLFDPAGRSVRTLMSGILPRGTASAGWDGSDDQGRPVRNGIYLCRVRAGSQSVARRITLLRSAPRR
jgi:hypothetical protein